MDVVPLDELLDPYQIAALIANKKSDFVIDAMVDRGDGGIYGPGDPVKITLVSKEPGYLYLFDIDPAGKPTLVFPRLGEPNQLKADTVYRLPGEGIEPFLVAGEQGQHDLKAIVTDRPLKLTGFRQPAQSQQQQQKQQPTQMPIAPSRAGRPSSPSRFTCPRRPGAGGEGHPRRSPGQGNREQARGSDQGPIRPGRLGVLRHQGRRR